AVPQRKEAGAGAVRRQVVPAASFVDDVAAERRQRQPGPEVRGTATHLLLLFPGCLARRFARGGALRRRGLRLLVAAFGHDLADDAARGAELHRHDAGVADDLAAERADALLGAGEVRDLDRE